MVNVCKLTNIFPGATVHIEGVITKLVVGVGSLEQKAVGTEFLLWHLSDALVIFITLFGIREKSIWLGTSEGSSALF